MSGGQFDLSMIVRGDGSGAVAAGAQTEAAIAGVDKAQRNAAAGSKALAAAQTDQMRAMGGVRDRAAQVAGAVNQAAVSYSKIEVAQRRVATAATAVDVAQTRVAASATKSAEAQARANLAYERAVTTLGAARGRLDLLTGAHTGLTAAQNRAAFGARNLGQQVGDFATQVSLGGGVIRAFSSQVGQAGFALSEMGGKAGRVGAFLTGPWGIALTVAALVAAPFVEKLFEGANAADDQRDKLEKAASAADSYGNAQSLLGKVIDTTTGKLKTQNTVLIQTIRLQAQANILAAQKEQRTAADALRGFGEQTTGQKVFGSIAAAGGGVDPNFADGPLGSLRSAVRDYIAATNDPRATTSALDRALNGTIRRIDALGKLGKLAGRDLIDAKAAVLALGTTLNDQKGNQLVLDALDGKGVDPLLKPYERGKKPPKPKKGPKPKADTVTPGYAEEIQRLNEQFDKTPTLIDKSAQATRRLDDIIADLTKRKPLGFDKLIADARIAKTTIQDGLQRPFDDFLRQQEDALAVQRLMTAGRVDEANALKVVQGLQASMAPLTTEQKDAILATIVALNAEGRALDAVRQKNAKYLEALGGIKGIVEDATQAFVRGDLGQLIRSPQKLLDVFQTLQGRKLFDQVFGGLFQELEDQVNGTTTVRDASDRMAAAVDKAKASVDRLGASAGAAADRLSGIPSPGASGSPVDANGDIVVTGQRYRSPTDIITTSLDKIADRIGIKDPKLFGRTIGQNAGKALEGSATGSIVAGVGKALGVNLSKTGAQIGGAIGNFLPIPGGAIIGSVVGGIAGRLIGGTKYGTASITSNDAAASVSGKGASQKAGASSAAEAVQQGIAQIAQQLGGQIGNYAVSIGTYNGEYRVSRSGSTGKLKGGNADVAGFGKDGEAAAISFAIADAIADGAVIGLSEAVQRALKSNSNVDRALSEALKVKEVERLIGGLGNALKEQFQAFDATALERTRIARQYGLDIGAVELLNAKERTKLVDDALKARIGSLTSFLDQLKYGDLAEGSAADKRAALIIARDKAQVDAEKGEEGAADTLAQLNAQLIALSRDAFGTAGGEFKSDRASAISGVERVIQMERERVAEAAKQQSDTSAALLTGQNETNDLLAQAVAKLTTIANGTGYTATGGAAANFEIVSRTQEL